MSLRTIYRQEIQEEIRAAIEVSATSFLDILRFNKVDLEWPSFEIKKGENKAVNVRGQDIASLKTWKEFLKYSGKQEEELTELVGNKQSLTDAYHAFLSTAYTERYRHLDVDGSLWMRKVVRLAVVYRIMENKLDGYLNGLDTFADERVAYYYTLVRNIREAMAGAARAFHHILEDVEDKEQAQKYIEKFFSEHYQKFRELPFPQRDDLLKLMMPEMKGQEDE